MQSLQHIGPVPSRQIVLSAFAHACVYAAVALSAWLAGHRAAPDASLAAIGLIVLAWAALSAWEEFHLPDPRLERVEDSPWRRRGALALRAVPVCGAVDARLAPVGLLAAGVLAVAAGGGLRVSAVVALGRYFTARTGVVAGHRVVRTGPYRWLRHPHYVGSVLLAAGTALAAGSALAWAPAAFTALAAWLAARHEEAFLRRHLPGYADARPEESW